MAIPSNPTLSELVAEALKVAGHASPSSALTTRAEDHWMEEIKNNIAAAGKKLRSMQASAITILNKGQARYAMPNDTLSVMSLTVLHGEITGTAQSGGNNTITLAAAEASSEDYLIGKEILITAGTAAREIGRCTAYNATTKVATVDITWGTNPASGSSYMIIDNQYDLRSQHVAYFDARYHTNIRGIPYEWYPVGDDDYGEIIIQYVPDKTYGVRIRYYLDVTRVDLTSDRMSTLYRKYRTVFIQGIVARAMRHDDDNRQDQQMQEYYQLLKGMLNREIYGKNISQLIMTNSD